MADLIAKDAGLSIAELSSLLDVINEPATILALDYRILACNQAYQSIYGEGGRVLERTCYDVSHGYSVPCDQAGESCPLKRCHETGQRQRVLHLHNTPDGEEHVDVEMNPVRNAQGELVCYLEIMHLVKEARATPGEGDGMVGRSPAFSRMLEMLRRAAPSDIAVLLLGESGTGKELAARAVHDGSRRARGPFITVECSGLTESLFESELFGHERGAFTGAVGRKKGLIEAARGGTLFLDEIGEIPLPQQVKLLRLIETGTYRTVGGIEPLHADFRLVCATHRNLKQLVDQGQFRQDLYYRISAFPVTLPALSERPEDLTLLINSLLVRIPGAEQVSVTEQAVKVLRQYSFPGNIRELRNILERGMLMTDDGRIGVQHLPPECLHVAEGAASAPYSGFPDEEVIPLDQLERYYLQRITSRFSGDNRSLAEHLGVSERTLYRKLSRLK
ncbi:sigma-54 interaction domain-containing protein [Nitrincola sp. A-D6]|uniref:sigma-54 interaction domain-containing protein n=1 Tax=Nitrincola sp. A-D6 TaxID=1545442 RepID=UPI000691BE2E|nr:sigma-54-dependent Fis family transcriptional regulator [Nitrincola sp. A-D6]